MGYSLERSAALLPPALPPNNLPMRYLSQKEAISKVKLQKWCSQVRRKGQLLPNANAASEGWAP